LDVSIHKAVYKDFVVICKLKQNELGYPVLNVEETLKRLEFFKNDEFYETFVAEKDDEVLGFVGIMKGVAYNYEGYYSQIYEKNGYTKKSYSFIKEL